MATFCPNKLIRREEPKRGQKRDEKKDNFIRRMKSECHEMQYLCVFVPDFGVYTKDAARDGSRKGRWGAITPLVDRSGVSEFVFFAK